MKTLKLIVPKITDDSIDLSAISKDFPGIIIVKQNDNAIGFIAYADTEDSWQFSTNIDTDESMCNYDTILEVIDSLTGKYADISFETVLFKDFQ